ncbi:MAG TPA: hypothetical protein DCF61_08470, partial [Alphaproteobacteria bacterium]|nr:hypothetical protein [Alphaproteobacteria bacterium]
LEDASTQGATAKAEHLLGNLGQINAAAGIEEESTLPRLGLSIGIAVADPANQEAQAELLNRADSAMYQAKRGGKNRFEFAHFGDITDSCDKE